MHIYIIIFLYFCLGREGAEQSEIRTMAPTWEQRRLLPHGDRIYRVARYVLSNIFYVITSLDQAVVMRQYIFVESSRLVSSSIMLYKYEYVGNIVY